MKHFKYIILIIILSIKIYLLYSQQRINIGDEWKHYKGISNPDKNDTSWFSTIFDDSDWDIGVTPFWYGDGTGGTELTDMQNAYTTLYIRKEFDVSTIENLETLKLFVDYDDGFKIWINGIIVLEQNAPDNPATAPPILGVDQENTVIPSPPPPGP